MLETIEITIDGYKFIVRYPNGVDDYKFYKERREASFYFEFAPNGLMHYEQSDQILLKHFPQLRADLIQLLREKKSKIFDYFEIWLDSREGGSQSGHNKAGQEGAIKSHLLMKWPLKED